MIQIRRAVTSFVLALAILLGASGLAFAGEPWPWRVEHTWYRSWITCESRGISLEMTGLYRDHRCRQDETSDPGRWTLWIIPSNGGGGSGGW